MTCAAGIKQRKSCRMNQIVKLKRMALPILFFSSCLMAIGELDRDELRRLEDVEIAGVRIDTMRDDDRKKIAVVEVNTFQNEDDDMEGFRIRIVVELTDKNKNSYLADFTGNRPGGLDSEYTGEDYWKMYLPHGDLERPNVTGYAIQYGFMDDETFLILAEDYKGVETVEELTARTSTSFPGTVRMQHYYMLDDESEGVIESVSKTIRAVQTKAAPVTQ